MLAPRISRAEDHLGGFQPFFIVAKYGQKIGQLGAFYTQFASTLGKHCFDAAAQAAATDQVRQPPRQPSPVNSEDGLSRNGPLWGRVRLRGEGGGWDGR